MVDFYHNKGIDTLKLACSLPNLANVCLQKSTTAMSYPFTEAAEDLLEKILQDVIGVPVYSIYRESCCVRDFCSGFDKLVQKSCRN